MEEECPNCEGDDFDYIDSEHVPEYYIMKFKCNTCGFVGFFTYKLVLESIESSQPKKKKDLVLALEDIELLLREAVDRGQCYIREIKEIILDDISKNKYEREDLLRKLEIIKQIEKAENNRIDNKC